MSGGLVETHSNRPSLDSSCLDPFSFVSVLVSIRSVSVRHLVAFRLGSDWPPLGSPRFGTESDLEFELVEHPARFDCSQLWANHARMQLELTIQISSDRVGVPRIA